MTATRPSPSLLPRRLAAALCAAILGGCAHTRSPVQIVRDTDAAMPRPIPNDTSLGPAVARFGRMLRTYRADVGDDVLVAVQRIHNLTGTKDGVPPDIRPLIVTTLGQIGRPVTPIGLDRRELETDIQVNTGNGEQKGVTMLRVPATIQLRGAITEYQTQVTKRRDIGFSKLIPLSGGDEADVGLDFDSDSELTVVAVDLHLFDYRTQTLLDRLTTSYRTYVVRSESSLDVGIFFEGSGLGFRARLSAAQSEQRAIRMASELALMNLLGRYFRVPWWRCVGDGAYDEVLAGWYRAELAAADRVAVTKRLLHAHGYPVDPARPGLNAAERRIRDRVMASRGFALGDEVAFLTQLWETVPLDRAMVTIPQSLVPQSDAQRRARAARAETSPAGGTKAGAGKTAAATSTSTEATAPAAPPEPPRQASQSTAAAAPAPQPAPGTGKACCPFLFGKEPSR